MSLSLGGVAKRAKNVLRLAQDGIVHEFRIIIRFSAAPVIHPDNVKAQMEGSIVDGLSAALFGEAAIEDGKVVPGNFDRYRRMTLAECPDIRVILVDSEQKRPGGVGEPGVPGAAPALTNAIFAATGQRIRELPIL